MFEQMGPTGYSFNNIEFYFPVGHIQWGFSIAKKISLSLPTNGIGIYPVVACCIFLTSVAIQFSFLKYFFDFEHC